MVPYLTVANVFEGIHVWGGGVAQYGGKRGRARYSCVDQKQNFILCTDVGRSRASQLGGDHNVSEAIAV